MREGDVMSAAVNPQVIGEHIRRLRSDRGLSVRAFAAQTGFSPSFISQLENGQVSPSLGSLQKIAEALGETWASSSPPPRPERSH
jgi:transcriptional regulator with XRE-family HTH domain